MTLRVLAVDDDREIRELIAHYLQRELFDVETAPDGETALRAVDDAVNAEEPFDIVVLDVMMPGCDGFDVLRGLRDRGVETPVLFLTAKREEEDVVQGLGMGADEYMTKPFSPAVLCARVKALLRLKARYAGQAGDSGGRMESGDEERQREGSGQGRRSRGRFALDEKRCRVYKDERPLELTATEYSLLRFLFEHPEQVFTRTQLHDQCWEQTYYDDNTVAVYVRRLRAKIEETPDRPVHLRTMRGLGYFFSPGDSPGDSKDPEDEGSPRDGEGHGP